MALLKTPMHNSPEVDEFMARLDHPHKADVQTIRDIIKSVSPDITEQIKWNAPTFGYKGEYMVTFNLHARDKIHLVFHNKHIAKVKSELLLGDYPDRRMMYFIDENEIVAKKQDLEHIIQSLLRLIGNDSDA